MGEMLMVDEFEIPDKSGRGILVERESDKTEDGNTISFDLDCDSAIGSGGDLERRTESLSSSTF